ncbi:nuclear transport factor 2 family protein [Pleurocapsales cyanobacterium LEGE 06147]|nr:nuclear transport factor 2 family protein [Pleurocapsales cyanobacterium LEGE 06147]
MNNNRRNFWLTGAALCLLVFIGGHKIRDDRIIKNNISQQSENSDQIFSEHRPFSGLFGQVANAENEDKAMKNERATIRQLTQQWFEAWSPQENTFKAEKLRPLYAQGEDEITIVARVGNEIVSVQSWEEYRQTWEPLMERFDYWSIQPEGEIQIVVDGDRAVSTFTWFGRGRYKDGREITSSRHATHVWQKRLGRWVIVHEHLSVAEK